MRAGHRDTDVTDSGGRIFQDIPDDLDESWTHGILVGGMASASDDIELARAYAEAGRQLIIPALASREAWRLAYPIFYLYRHALELHLKAIVRPSKPSHRLLPLIDALEGRLREELHSTIPPRVKCDLLLFADIDPDAQGFRFSQTTAGKPRFLPGEYWVPLARLRAFMDELFDYIEGVHRQLPD